MVFLVKKASGTSNSNRPVRFIAFSVLHLKRVAIGGSFKPLINFVAKKAKNGTKDNHYYEELVYCKQPITVDIHTDSAHQGVEGLAVDALSVVMAFFALFGALFALSRRFQKKGLVAFEACSAVADLAATVFTAIAFAVLQKEVVMAVYAVSGFVFFLASHFVVHNVARLLAFLNAFFSFC